MSFNIDDVTDHGKTSITVIGLIQEKLEVSPWRATDHRQESGKRNRAARKLPGRSLSIIQIVPVAQP